MSNRRFASLSLLAAALLAASLTGVAARPARAAFQRPAPPLVPTLGGQRMSATNLGGPQAQLSALARNPTADEGTSVASTLLPALVVAGLLSARVGLYTDPTGQEPVGPGVYRDTAAPASLVYLVGHSFAGFRPLYDAYLAGELRPGLAAWYDGRRFELAVVQLVADRDSAAAWSQPDRDPLRLQFCLDRAGTLDVVLRFAYAAPAAAGPLDPGRFLPRLRERAA